MARIGDLLEDRAATSLVGRVREMGALFALLDDNGPRVAFVHGLAGIGKTSLVTAFAARARRQGATVVQCDCAGIEPTPEGFLRELSAAAGSAGASCEETAGRLGGLGHRVVVVLDTYERFRLLDSWVRQTFVPSLPDRLGVVIASRDAPLPPWRATYRDLLQTIQLGGLSEPEALTMLGAAAVDRDTACQIVRTTHGHPLALHLAASALAERHDMDLSDTLARSVVEELTQLFLADVVDPQTRDALEAAAVVRRITQPLLGALLPEAAPRDTFERLHGLPFVELSHDGLVMHDAVQEALLAGLQARDPERYHELRRAAWTYLRGVEPPADRSELFSYTADVVFLLDNPAVRESFFPSQPALAVEALAPGDLTAMDDILRRHDGPEAATHLGAWHDVDPSAFAVVRDAELDMAGFYCMLEPTRVPAAQLAADPVTACWVRHLETSPVPEGQTALFLRRWLTRDTGEAPSDVQAACWCDVKRSYLVMRDSLRRLYVTARDPQPYAEALGALGFYMLDETVEVDGQAYGTAVLDFGPRLIHSWLMRLVDNETGLAQTDLLDEGARELVVDGERVSLTPLEFSLLVYLRQRPDEVVTRPQLLKEVWGEDYLAGSNVVDVVVRSLRRKLGSYASVIETVTGAGYRYRA